MRMIFIYLFIYLSGFLRNFYKEIRIFGVEDLGLKKMISNVEISRLFLKSGWRSNLGENNFYLFIYLDKFLRNFYKEVGIFGVEVDF